MFILVPSSLVDNEYSLETELPTLSLSYNEFWNIIDDVTNLINKFDPTFLKAEKYISLNDGIKNETIDNPTKNSPLTVKKAYTLYYVASNYAGTISKLNISFSDYKRSIIVKGNNMLEIQSVIDNLERSFSNHHKFISGPIFRIISWFILLICSFSLQYKISVEGERIKISARNGWPYFIGLGLLLFTITASWGVYDFELIFPGFLIYNEDISFINKYADYFTFWGFVITILGLAYTIIKKNNVSTKS